MRDASVLDASVSVVIPTYNRPLLARRAVESALAQTHPYVEVVVVDDGSTDDTPQMLAAFGERIRVIRRENGGGTAARNSGLAAARGTFVNVLDHDDLFRPDKIERQLRVFAKRPDVAVVHCGFERIDAEGAPLDRRVQLPAGDLTTLLAYGCYIWSGGPLVRRAVLDDVGPFSEAAWSSDAELWLRIALAGYRFACVQDCLGAYRVLPDSSMRDVARTEALDMPTYGRVFADPRLPEGARRVEDQAYFVQRFWLSGRYYAVGDYEDGKRNLTEALRHRPDLATRAGLLLTKLVESAVDLRVEDPLAYQHAFLANLPEELDPIVGPMADELLAWTRVAAALRLFGRTDEADAASRLRDAALAPALAGSGGRFLRLVLDRARGYPGDPVAFVSEVFEALPAGAWRAQRPYAFAHAHWFAAARHRGRGRHASALRHSLAALRRRPSIAREPLRRLAVRSGLRVHRGLP